MNNRIRQYSFILCLFLANTVNAQSVKKVFSNSGIWGDYGTPVSAAAYPYFHGRLVNFNWADIEISPNVWNWTGFDSDLQAHVADNMPVTFMIYTRMNAPNWIFSNGVPKVNETNSAGVSVGYSPYYLDSDYNVYFKRMITNVRLHVESLAPALRNQIIGVQACFGNTGDQIAYKGNVPKQYAITDAQFDSLFEVYSLYYYNEYKNASPAITMLSNPDAEHPDQQYWLNDNCPGGWTKCGVMAKGSQLNTELDKVSWLYDILNKPWNGQYIKGRSEIVGDQLYANWWTTNEAKQMFATMCYCIYWGMDWPNETSGILMDPKFDSSFKFFNKYAGQKVAGLATNAMCALKDVLDASDSVRFPASIYGTVDRNNKSRFVNIYNSYSSYGALLQDISSVSGNEYDCLDATGTNDVGWRLLPGNYERYLHQIDANITSSGYWNLDGGNADSMYGRFARGFDVAKGKNALYFDVDNAFLKNAPLKAKYPVTIAVTYYNKGNGSWQLFYDAQGQTNKPSLNITCTNTNTWKKATFVLNDAYFGNRADRNSDFYIKNTGSSNVMFSIVELSRPQQNAAAFITTALNSFDTVCQNSIVTPQNFVLNAANLNGSKIQVGPLKGFSFSISKDSGYASLLSFSNYDSALNYTIYVKINSQDTGFSSGKIPITGGGMPKASVNVSGTVLNSSPLLNANATTINCYNNKNGAIALKPSGGIGPFTYNWTKDVQQSWNAATQNIDSLNVANYTVTVSSLKGCSISKTFNITQPNILVTSVTQDSAIKCRGGFTTVNVTALGGTAPYSGTGVFTVPAGFQTYTVTDAKGCTDPQGYSVAGGTIAAPNKPGGINGPATVSSHQTNLVYSVQNATGTNTYTWTVPADAKITAGQNTSSITVNWGSTNGNVSSQAGNSCGTSPVFSTMVKVSSSQNAFEASLPGIKGSEEMRLMPNPVTDIAFIRFYSEKSSSYTIKLTDISGKTLMIKKGTAIPGTNTQNLDVKNFAAGVYFITFINDKGEIQSLKMIKQ